MIYQFGEFELDDAQLELRFRGAAQLVPPRVLRAIVHLLRHRERAVSRDELVDVVWGGLAFPACDGSVQCGAPSHCVPIERLKMQLPATVLDRTPDCSTASVCRTRSVVPARCVSAHVGVTSAKVAASRSASPCGPCRSAWCSRPVCSVAVARRCACRARTR